MFAVGALDAYLTELAAETLVARLKDGKGNSRMRDVLKRVSNEMPTLAIETAILAEGADRLALVQSAVVEHFQTAVSAFGPKAVARVVEMLDASTSNVWKAVAETGLKEAAERLDHWTGIRHKVVHQGQRVSVQRERDARTCVHLVKVVADAIEAEVERSSATIASDGA